MPRFFVDRDDIRDDIITLTGDDAVHISRSLRMKRGDGVTVCDFFNYEYDCTVSDIDEKTVRLSIIAKHPSENEPDVRVKVYQALPKAQKMELIIQKCVELGAYAFVPVLTEHCISRPDERSGEKKNKRWNAISEQASQQSGRAMIPEVGETLTFENAIAEMKKSDIAFMCYECEDTLDLKTFLEGKELKNKEISFLVGPEGGFSEKEAELARSCGIPTVSLGKRILRTETAPICVVSGIMFLTDNMK